MSAVVSVGIDIGSQKTMLAKDDADIIRTDTGSTYRATLVAFNENERLCGEEAFAHIMGDSTIPMFNVLMGKTIEEVMKSDDLSMKHRKASIASDESGRLVAEVTYAGKAQKLHVTALAGMFLAQLKKRIVEETSGQDVHYSIVLPTNHKHNPSIERAYKEACFIAGIDASKVFTADSADCLVATYARKLAGLNPGERGHLENKYVLLLDVGHTQTTAVVVLVENVSAPGTDINVRKVCVHHDEALGSYHFDMQLFDHFAATKCAHCKIEPGSKKGFRLLSGCEKLRKLLSQLPEAQVTVEHLAEDTDINLTLKREDLVSLCENQLNRIKDLLTSALFTEVNGTHPGTHLGAVEVLGGGVRMQVVQQIVHTVVGQHMPFGFKLDDSAVALGAALLCTQSLTRKDVSDESKVEHENPITAARQAAPTVGFTDQELDAAYSAELSMQAKDYEIRQVMEQRNRLESFILELRSAPSKKQGKSIDSAALNALLDEYENWLWDSYSDPTVTLDVYLSKYDSLHSSAVEMCKTYFEAVANEKAALEKSLNEEAIKAAAEKEAEGGDDEDHDTRKLKKADRMRLVIKNKEEGTELFKDGNYRPAAARYHKALTHSAKFFDLTKEDETEVNTLKLSLYLNLASCYIKMENWDNVLRNCNDALAIDSKSVKALFRRAQYYEFKKDWDKALTDLKACGKSSAAEDKAVLAAQERIKKEIAKEKAKEKKTWGKMFG